MYCSVLVTAPDLRTARDIGRTMVERGLAACVNIWEVSSIYRWKGEVHEGPEAAMLFKVPREGFDALRSAILEVHPYEVPCIVGYAITAGHPPYLDWISESVPPSGGGDQKPRRTGNDLIGC